jgi:UDP:flavonoid glycosyltransferase YjiC (YdhE family)
LASGVPVLLFPTHYEQYLTARRLEQTGAGGWIPPTGNAASIQAGVQAMTADPRYLANARAFAQRYPAWSPHEQRRRIVARIEQLVGVAASPILSRSPSPEPP